MSSKFAGVGGWRGDGKQLAVCRLLLVETFCLRGYIRVSLGVTIEEHFKQLSAKWPTQRPSRVAIGQDDSAHVALRQPDHIAVVADHVPAMMDHRGPVLA